MCIIYEANDGARFNTSEECECYESKNSILLDRKNFLCFDENFRPVKLCEGYNFTEIIRKAYFFICFTEEAADAFQEKVDEVDESKTFPPYIRKNVLYGWAADNNDCWSDVWEVVEEFEKQAGYLRKAVHSMNNEIERAKQGK